MVRKKRDKRKIASMIKDNIIANFELVAKDRIKKGSEDKKLLELALDEVGERR